MKGRKALIGFHEPLSLETTALTLRNMGYDVTITDDPSDMLAYTRGGGSFDVYLMDANLGSPGSDFYDPAEEVFGSVRDTGGRFYALSGNLTTVRMAVEAGIPCRLKTEIFDVMRTINPRP